MLYWEDCWQIMSSKDTVESQELSSSWRAWYVFSFGRHENVLTDPPVLIASVTRVVRCFWSLQLLAAPFAAGALFFAPPGAYFCLVPAYLIGLYFYIRLSAECIKISDLSKSADTAFVVPKEIDMIGLRLLFVVGVCLCCSVFLFVVGRGDVDQHHLGHRDRACPCGPAVLLGRLVPVRHHQHRRQRPSPGHAHPQVLPKPRHERGAQSDW